MAVNFLSLPAELRNMIYGKYLFDDLNASEYFNNQVKLAQLHVPELARAYPPQPANTPASQQRPDIYDEVLTYFYSRMTATMNIRTALAFWNHWTLRTASDDFVAHLRKFELIGCVVCNGYTHAKIFIDLNDHTNMVSIGNDQPQAVDTNMAGDIDKLDKSKDVGKDDDAGETQNRCRLLELPAELRTAIYELALSNLDIVADLASRTGCEAIADAAALTMTCKRIHKECANLVYDLNVIKFKLPKNEARANSTIQTLTNLQRPWGTCSLKVIELWITHKRTEYDFSEWIYDTRRELKALKGLCEKVTIGVGIVVDHHKMVVRFDLDDQKTLREGINVSVEKYYRMIPAEIPADSEAAGLADNVSMMFWAD
ncbi:hypothetical protein PRZ48_009798 [Zasmidium cellare]|uniref:F-box domain-containing protein n=1 Tax=Zasmidium cellare TaxID=395010 RepID=A0ABR0EDC2_ZASCE|nr:hypothetical protein PRZ48_009798 [Zasmidium cellare]